MKSYLERDVGEGQPPRRKYQCPQGPPLEERFLVLSGNRVVISFGKKIHVEVFRLYSLPGHGSWVEGQH